MATTPYFASYGRFEATTKEEYACLLGADSIVGDTLELVYARLGDTEKIQLNNRFGGHVGTLVAASAAQVQLCLAKEWCVRVLLASVYQNQRNVEPLCWGEVVIIAYPPRNAYAFDVFSDTISSMLHKGIRPQVDLAESALQSILDAHGNWQPAGRVDPLKAEGSILVKNQASLNERLVEQARMKNPGCMLAGWLFIALLVCAVLLALWRLLGF